MTAQLRGAKAGRSPFGELLSRLRTERGLTQEALAMASEGDRISSRSITNYERSVDDAYQWILPHRTGLQMLSNSLKLDPVEHRRFVEAWNKTKATKTASSLNHSSSGFVRQGREHIVSAIMNRWEEAQKGNPQFVMIGGNSGMGKTMLSRHISDMIASQARTVLISWGEAQNWASPVDPYLALRHATDRLLVPPPSTFTLPGLNSNRPVISQEQIDMVMRAIPSLGGVLISESTIRQLATDSDEYSSRLVDSMIEERSATESIGRWEEYASLITNLAQSFPIVLVLENFHWASDQTCSLLQHLAYYLSNSTDVKLMVICTYRSSEIRTGDDSKPHPFAKLLQTTSHLPITTSIQLSETLAPKLGKAFIRGLVHSYSMISAENENALIDWLYKRTSGQPMIAVETIRQLTESEALVRVPRSTSWQFNIEKLPQDIPTPITSLMGIRVNHIDRRRRYMLEVAAAMGETALPEVMADVLKMDIEQLQDDIETILVDQHEILVPGPSISAGHRTHGSYRFQHSMLREYIYAEIKPSRRRRIHLDIAESLTRHFTNTDTVAMGEATHHYMMAEDWHSAQMFAYRLAQLHTGRLDWELSSIWFDQAEEMALRAQDAQQLWRARAARLVVMRGLNQYDEAIALGQRIFQQARLHGWSSTLGFTYLHLGEVYYDLGQLEQSADYTHRAHDIHVEEEEYDLAAAAQAMLSHTTYRQGKYDIAREHARKSMSYSSSTHNSWVRAEAILAAANCDSDLGYYREAIENYEASIELAAMSGKLSNQLLAALNIGLCRIMLDEVDGAIEILQQTMEQLKRMRVTRISAWGDLYLGHAYEAAGDYPAAAAAFESSAIARSQSDQQPVLYDSIGGQLSVAIHLGDKKAARAYLNEIVTYIDEYGLEGIEDGPRLLLNVARAHLFMDDDAGYWRRLEQAHELIINRASLIQDHEATQSYLTRVPVNAEIQRRLSERANG